MSPHRPDRTPVGAPPLGERHEHVPIPFDSGGVDEIGVVPWPMLLRRRIARRVGIQPRWAVLWVVLGGLFTVGVTITLLVVSLSSVATDLGVSTSTATWVITGPMLAFGVVGPAFGKAGDLWGHKKVFVAGLFFAGVFALATALAWNAASMITFRILSASAGSACGPSAMAFINRLFEPDQRVRPLSYWSLVTAGGPVIGVVIGGPLVDSIGWRAMFFAQAPLCLIGVVVALWLLPETERMSGVRFDVRGSIALGIGATSLLAATNQGSQWGWSSPATVGLYALGVTALAAFVQIERTTPHPLIVLDWLRTRNVAWPVVGQALGNFAYMGSFVLAPRVMQDGLSMTAAATGLLVIARPLTFSLAAPVAGSVTVRIGERISGTVGTAVVALSMLAWIAVGESTPSWYLAVAFGLTGLGFAIATPALTALMSSAVDDRDLGVAGAMQQLMSQMGAVAGSVVLTTVAADAGPGALGPYHTAFVVAAVVASLGAVAASLTRSTH